MINSEKCNFTHVHIFTIINKMVYIKINDLKKEDKIILESENI